MIEPDDIFRLAKSLHREKDSEIHQRMAVARAYYSVLHLVRCHLRLPEDIGKHKSIHGFVREQLFSVPPQETPEFLKKCKFSFDKLRTMRVDSDYYCSKAIDLNEVNRLMAVVDEIFTESRRHNMN